MIICFEGCDLAGKTTFVKAAQKALLRDYTMIPQVLKRGKPAPDVKALAEYGASIGLDYNPRLLLDRWHVGEDVYGPLYRGRSRLTPASRAFLDGLLVSHGAILVHVTASTPVLQRRHRDRGEDYLRYEDVDHVRRAFSFQCGDAEHWVTVNTSAMDHGSVEKFANALVAKAMARERQADRILRLYTDYVGALRPSVLLVGDEPANVEVPPYGAFTPWSGNSAEYLFNALYDVELLIPMRVPRIGWVNSSQFGWVTPLKELHLVLGEPPIIALGNEAELQLRRSGLGSATVGKVYHPQYWRRFRHHERVEYGKSIAELTCQLS